jgi:uncharacterized protein YyaL (SSP411 family)
MTTHTNRLAGESSPYLLQHARNPVDWHPWGPEALERAKAEDKPILLSVGYAACHWCHVMERESFEDAEIAALMNELFVNVKVDREERPDLDQIYQLTVQLMGRQGGWPLTVFLTPTQRPFYAGTYFPPEPRFGMAAFPDVLRAVAEAYKTRRDEVELQAQEITHAIGRVQRVDRPEHRDFELGEDLLRRASRKLIARFDDTHGGFGRRPKFPNAMALEVLLRRGVVEGDDVCASSARLALDRMRAGGIWDHLRGGFHRYSTDEKWLVPHFEKMLYDNALLLRLYVEGYRAFKDELYADTAREIVAYLLAEMRDPCGAFYASQDADSEGVEGRFFVFSPGQIKRAIGDDPLAIEVALRHFDVTEEGNFEETGATVLSAQRSLDRVAISLGVAPSEAHAALARAKTKLLAAREARPRPARDDKILASWNGLLIGALADAGRALGEPSWVAIAEEAFAAIEVLIEGGRVRRYRTSEGVPAAAAKAGFLDDQGFVGNAALDLYAATGDVRYVAVARSIADVVRARFWDDVAGGFFFTASDADRLIARTKDVFDQAIPSGSSMAALLFLRLSEMVGGRYLAPAEKHLRTVAAAAAEDAFALGQTTLVLDRLVRGSVDVVIVGDPAGEAAGAFRSAAFEAYLPNRNVVLVDPARPETADAVSELAADKVAPHGETVAYVCRDRTCSAPMKTVDALRALLAERS